MKETKLKWYIADKKYVNYLRQFDEKINNPTSNVSKRCCNFKILEEKGQLYNKKASN